MGPKIVKCLVRWKYDTVIIEKTVALVLSPSSTLSAVCRDYQYGGDSMMGLIKTSIEVTGSRGSSPLITSLDSYNAWTCSKMLSWLYLFQCSFIIREYVMTVVAILAPKLGKKNTSLSDKKRHLLCTVQISLFEETWPWSFSIFCTPEQFSCSEQIVFYLINSVTLILEIFFIERLVWAITQMFRHSKLLPNTARNRVNHPLF